jgi:hypothetical protein
MAPSPHLRMETDSVSKTLYFLLFKIPGKWTKSRIPVIPGNLPDKEVSLSISKLLFIPLYPNPMIL